MIFLEIFTVSCLLGWGLYRYILPVQKQIEEIERKQQSYFDFRKKRDESFKEDLERIQKELIRMSTYFSTDVSALSDSIEGLSARIKELEGKK